MRKTCLGSGCGGIACSKVPCDDVACQLCVGTSTGGLALLLSKARKVSPKWGKAYSKVSRHLFQVETATGDCMLLERVLQKSTNGFTEKLVPLSSRRDHAWLVRIGPLALAGRPPSGRGLRLAEPRSFSLLVQHFQISSLPCFASSFLPGNTWHTPS